MKRLNFESNAGVRFMCSKAEVNQIIVSANREYEIIGVTPKGIIVEFKEENTARL